jgi:sugar lactone lactonase YvrE
MPDRRAGFDPVVWSPPPRPAVELTESTLPTMRLLYVNGLGPQDVLLEDDGHVLTGVDGGRVLRVRPDGRQVTEIADTGGRPLGLQFLPDGDLLVCDAYRGLLRLDRGTGATEVLAESAGGRRINFCSNAALATDGTVYFTDASSRFGFHQWKADLLEHAGTGRLLRRDRDGSVDVVLDGLQLPNGVALTPDGSAVVVAETGSFRLSRVPLSGPAAGRAEPLNDAVPGYPWGVSLGTDGLLWVAVASPRSRVMDELARRAGTFRQVASRLPPLLQPKPVPSVWVMAVDPATGAVVHDFHAPPGYEFLVVTGVREWRGSVYLGSVISRAVAVFEWSGTAASAPTPERAYPAVNNKGSRQSYPV